MKNQIQADKIIPFIEEKLHLKFSSLSHDQKAFLVRKQGSGIVLDPKDEQSIIARISDIATDRSGEVMLPEGCDYSDYMNNSLVCWQHDYSVPPIAKITEIQVTEKSIFAKIQFGTTQMCKDFYQLVKDGILSACSVGFIATEELYAGTSEFKAFVQKNIARLTDTDSIQKIITKWTLLENSMVNIPCNQNAVVIAKSMSGIPDRVKDAIEKSAIKEQVPAEQPEKPAEVPPEPKPEEAKPYPNEHAFRITDPAKYQKFARKNDEFGAGIDAIYGITEDGKAELQAIRFDATRWTFEDAQKWVKEHGYTPIEESAATEEAKEEPKQPTEQHPEGCQCDACKACRKDQDEKPVESTPVIEADACKPKSLEEVSTQEVKKEQEAVVVEPERYFHVIMHVDNEVKKGIYKKTGRITL